MKGNVNVTHLQVGRGTTIEPGAVLEGTTVELGEGCYIAPDVWIGGAACRQPHSGLWLGDGSVIGHRCIVNTGEGVRIGRDTALSIGVQIYTHHHWQSVLDGYPAVHAPVTIGSNVHIGANAVIGAGTELGDGVLVEANSVVTGFIPARAYVAGNPAQVVRILEPLSARQQERVLARLVESAPGACRADGLAIRLGDTVFDCATRTITGPRTPEALTLRDWLRRRGIRFQPRLWHLDD